MTHIGKHELNQNESEWLIKYAEGVYDRSAKDIQAALNKVITAEDVQAFLKETQTVQTYVEPEPVDEPKLEEEIEEKDDERNID